MTRQRWRAETGSVADDGPWTGAESTAYEGVR